MQQKTNLPTILDVITSANTLVKELNQENRYYSIEIVFIHDILSRRGKDGYNHCSFYTLEQVKKALEDCYFLSPIDVDKVLYHVPFDRVGCGQFRGEINGHFISVTICHYADNEGYFR